MSEIKVTQTPSEYPITTFNAYFLFCQTKYLHVLYDAWNFYIFLFHILKFYAVCWGVIRAERKITVQNLFFYQLGISGAGAWVPKTPILDWIFWKWETISHSVRYIPHANLTLCFQIPLIKIMY